MDDAATLRAFIGRFAFKNAKDGYVGVERERFLVAPDGFFVPRSPEFLSVINDPRWTYELSACQVEDRTKPHKSLSAVKRELLENDNNGRMAAERLGLRLVHQEVGSATMPLDVYPDPRYLTIVRTIPRKRLRAACRVTGTHLHFGVKSITHAIAVHNALIPHLEELCALGDHSHGKRLRLYKAMAISWRPVVYENLQHFFAVARAQRFADNPRNCWHLIRISVHGTVELRMFGVTDFVDEILYWISRVRALIQ